MNSSSIISHKGVIEFISDRNIKVRITNLSACSGCHAKGACTASDQEDKIIDTIPNGQPYKIGQNVMVIAKQSMGFKALFMGYVLPFLIVLTSLIIFTCISMDEINAGIFSLAILIPYYTILYLCKDSIKKHFIFEIQNKPLI